MTRRERLEAKLEKRREWAQGAAAKSQAALNTAHQMASVIPFGQPILVGHHSESRDRNYRGRIHNKMRKGCELQDLAEHHTSKAAGLESQLDRSIFSDDPDAIEALEAKLADLEVSRERMKLVNKLYRKGDAEGLKAIGLDLEMLKTKLAEAGSYWGSAPHLPYELQNVGGRIQDAKRRIDTVKARNLRAAAAERAGGMTIERYDNGYASVIFAEKPERTILSDLKAAGFRWGDGRWCGYIKELPASVVEMEPEPETAA